MPELPEIRAHAERLGRELAGRPFEQLDLLSFTALKTASPAPDAALGHRLERVGQRGKYLLLEVGPITFVTHLMQGGRLVPDTTSAARPRNGRARLRFGPVGEAVEVVEAVEAAEAARDDHLDAPAPADPDLAAATDGSTGPTGGPGRVHHPAEPLAVLLTEAGTERRAGIWCVPTEATSTSAPLAELGPEVDALDAAGLLDRLGARNQRLHGALRDQRVMAGLGRRLANEVCHRAELSPFTMTGHLRPEQAERVRAAIRDAVAEGLAAERARDDMSSAAERPGRVHGRAGSACPVCGDTIRSVEYTGYRIDYCPACQTGGTLLADNTTSRFLK